MGVETKVCRACKTAKPLSDFPTRLRKGVLTVVSKCYGCMNESAARWYRERNHRQGRHKGSALLPGEVMVQRRCMRPDCRKLFRTVQDYRMCSGCRNNPVKDGLNVFMCL